MPGLPMRPHWATPGGSMSRALRVFAADYPTALRLRLTHHGRPPEEWDRGGLAPVVLIPGVYEPWWYLAPIGARLHALGHPVIPLPTLSRNTRPIAATADLVARVLVERDLRGVVIVAHSKGGIVGKRLLVRKDSERRIDRLVAIAAPFGGSGMASFMPARALRDFRIADPELRALGRRRDVNARITSIYPVFDPHIPEGSRLAGARNVPLRMAGHFGVLAKPAAIDAIVREVGRPA